MELQPPKRQCRQPGRCARRAAHSPAPWQHPGLGLLLPSLPGSFPVQFDANRIDIPLSILDFVIDSPRLCNFRPSSRIEPRFRVRFILERVHKIENREQNRKNTFDYRFSIFRGVRHCYRPWYIRGKGALPQSPDTSLVPLLSILVIKYWLVLEGARVQWQFLRELSKGYLCGHRYSLGTVLLLDDTLLSVC